MEDKVIVEVSQEAFRQLLESATPAEKEAFAESMKEYVEKEQKAQKRKLRNKKKKARQKGIIKWRYFYDTQYMPYVTTGVYHPSIRP